MHHFSLHDSMVSQFTDLSTKESVEVIIALFLFEEKIERMKFKLNVITIILMVLQSSCGEQLQLYDIKCRSNYNLTARLWISLSRFDDRLSYSVSKCNPSEENDFCVDKNTIWSAQSCQEYRLLSKLYFVECALTPKEQKMRWFAKMFCLKITVGGKMNITKKFIPITPLLRCQRVIKSDSSLFSF